MAKFEKLTLSQLKDAESEFQVFFLKFSEKRLKAQFRHFYLKKRAFFLKWAYLFNAWDFILENSYLNRKEVIEKRFTD